MSSAKTRLLGLVLVVLVLLACWFCSAAHGAKKMRSASERAADRGHERVVLSGARDDEVFTCNDLTTSPDPNLACPEDVPKCFANLSVKGLTSVPKLGTLECAEDIRILALVGNQITAIRPGAFNELSELQRLGLSNNKIKTIKSEVFDELPELVDLNLLGNQLVDFPDVSKLKKLQYLDLGNNKIDFLTSSVYRLKKLEFLNLEGNKVDEGKVGSPSTCKTKELCKKLRAGLKEQAKTDEYLMKMHKRGMFTDDGGGGQYL